MSELDKIETGTTSQAELLYETRSEEMQELIGKMPSWIVRRGILGFCIVLVMLIVGAALMKIPETVNCPVTIVFTDTTTIVRASAGGIVQQILVKEGDQVKKGKALIVFNSGADFDEVQKALSIAQHLDSLKDLKEIGELVIPSLKSLGELQNTFEDIAFSLYVSKNGMDQSKVQNLKMGIKKFLELYKLWENKYLIKSKTEGQLTFLKKLDQDLRISVNEELIAVSPPRGKRVLRAWGVLPASMRNSVEIGKPEKIMLNYGEGGADRLNMQGTIKAIAKVPVNNRYFIDIDIPDSFLKGKITGPSVTNGVLEIVIKQQSVLARLMAKYLKGS